MCAWCSVGISVWRAAWFKSNANCGGHVPSGPVEKNDAELKSSIIKYKEYSKANYKKKMIIMCKLIIIK